jgi:hypothetical protein
LVDEGLSAFEVALDDGVAHRGHFGLDELCPLFVCEERHLDKMIAWCEIELL